MPPTPPVELIQGDSLTELKRFEDNSIDALVTDPPAGIAFMGKSWDTRDRFQVQMRAIFEECLRVLKPGAHGFVWALPRTSHWTATALEEAGFEIRDVVTHIFGSGFPKSHNIGKTIDKMEGNERRVIKEHPLVTQGFFDKTDPKTGRKYHQSDTQGYKIWEYDDITEGTSEWEGWGSALKPAAEHWILVRKPLEKGLSIAQNVLKWNTGAINIDASRIGNADGFGGGGSSGDSWMGDFYEKGTGFEAATQGRFPANFMLSHHEECEEVGTREEDISINGQGNDKLFHGGFDPSDNFSGRENKATTSIFKCHPDCPVAELDRQSGICSPGGWGHVKTTGFGSFGGGKSEPTGQRINGTAGGASRFFYCAKPSKSERNAGLDKFEEQKVGDGREIPADNAFQRGDTDRKNSHPTVKPTKLMSYLITMITPPAGKVLDPFAGSCTTGVAAIETKREFIGIEREEEYVEIGEARMKEARGENDLQNRVFV